MMPIQLYFLILFSSLIIGFGSWIMMQIKELTRWEYFWGVLALIGLASSVITILIGFLLLIKLVIQFLC